MYDLCCFTFLNSLSAYMANKYSNSNSNWQELGSWNWCWWKRHYHQYLWAIQVETVWKKLMEFYTSIIKNLSVLQDIQQGWQILAKHWNGNHVVFHAINSPILIYFQYFCVDGYISISVCCGQPELHLTC